MVSVCVFILEGYVQFKSDVDVNILSLKLRGRTFTYSHCFISDPAYILHILYYVVIYEFGHFSYFIGHLTCKIMITFNSYCKPAGRAGNNSQKTKLKLKWGHPKLNRMLLLKNAVKTKHNFLGIINLWICECKFCSLCCSGVNVAHIMRFVKNGSTSRKKVKLMQKPGTKKLWH